MILLVTKASRILIDGKSPCSHKTTKSMFSIASVLKWFESWWLVCTMGTFKTGLQDSLNLLVISSIFLKKKKRKDASIVICFRISQYFLLEPLLREIQAPACVAYVVLAGEGWRWRAVESQLPCSCRCWSGRVPRGAWQACHIFHRLYLRYQWDPKLQISYLPKAGLVLISPDVTGENVASASSWWWSWYSAAWRRLASLDCGLKIPGVGLTRRAGGILTPKDRFPLLLVLAVLQSTGPPTGL